MKEHILETEEYRLDAESIDRISDRIGAFLTEAGSVTREVLWNRLAVECFLEIWGEKLGEENACTFSIGTSFGVKYLTLKAPGIMVDATRLQEDTPDDEIQPQMFIGNSDLMSSLGLKPEYHYIDGYNVLKIWARSKTDRKSKFKLLGALTLGAVILAIKAFSPAAGQAIYDYAVNPIYTMFMRILSTICGPLVLFSIISSICGMGDMASFGKMGASLLRRFLPAAAFLLALSGLISVFFFPLSTAGEGGMGDGFQKLIQMIVEIAPSDAVSPLMNGNALQIVFIGTAVGLTMLFLSTSIPELMKVLLQIYSVVQQIMRFLGKVMPYFMGIAVLKMLLPGSLLQTVDLLKPTFLIWVGCIAVMIADLIIVSLQTRTGIGELFRKTFPASLIALMTSSSSAAMEKMNEDCTEGLGVSTTVAEFGIPFGQVIFKPTASIAFFVCALFAAEKAGVPINLIFILMDFIVSYVLGISAAPVPGAMATCLSILLLQLGIPMDYVALGVGLSLLIDNISTMANVQMLQLEVFAAAKRAASRKRP